MPLDGSGAAGVELPEPEKLPVHEVWGSRVADA
jgi:hypothetical protein